MEGARPAIYGLYIPTFEGSLMQKAYLHRQEDARFRILTEVIQQITSILDINELLVQVVRLIQQTFDYYHVGIGLIEGRRWSIG